MFPSHDQSSISGVEHVWFLNKKTYEYNKHIIVEGQEVVVIKTIGDKGYANYNYAAPGDLSVQPQNVPIQGSPQLNTPKSINYAAEQEKKDLKFQQKIWRGQALNLAMAAVGPCDEYNDEFKEKVIGVWGKIYKDPDFYKRMIVGFDSFGATMTEEDVEKVFPASDHKGPTEDDVNLDSLPF